MVCPSLVDNSGEAQLGETPGQRNHVKAPLTVVIDGLRHDRLQGA